jgi:hypothetical protein
MATDGDRESSHTSRRSVTDFGRRLPQALTAKRAARRHGHGIGPEKFRRPDSVSTQGTAPG